MALPTRTPSGPAAVADSGKAKSERQGDRVIVTREMENIAPAPTHVEVTGYSGNVDRWQIIEFIPPCFISLQVGNAKHGTGGFNADPADKLINRRTLHIATPETEDTTHYFWVSTYPSDSMTPEQEQIIYDRTLEVLDEDVRMIEGNRHDTTPNSHDRYQRGRRTARHAGNAGAADSGRASKLLTYAKTENCEITAETGL